MLRHLLTASFVALLVAGVLPAGVLAAAPVAGDVTTSTPEDTAATITLTATDAGGADLSAFTIASQPLLGSLDPVGAPVCPPGTPGTCTADVVYHPNLDANGSDSFTYTASSLGEISTPATVSITVDPVNDPPIAENDPGTACGYSAALGGSFPIPEDWPGGGVAPDGWFAFVDSCAPMRNDTDPDGDELTIELIGEPDHGEAVILPDGFLAYRPDPDYSTPAGDQPGGTWLSDTIRYRVFDGSAYSGTASYQLWIAPVNDAPSFTAPDVSVDEDSGPYVGAWATAVSPGPGESDQEVSFVVDAISDPWLFASAPLISSTGELSFEPAPDFFGQSTVTVHARDDGGLEDYDMAGVSPDDTSDPVVFTISVTPTNDAPAPVSFSTMAQWGFQWLLGELAAYDIDGDDTTAFTVVTPPEHGSLEIPSPILCQGVMPRGCGTVVLYTADTGYVGQDNFTYTATDGTATSAAAMVTISVEANATPACDNLLSTGPEDAPQSGTVTCTDAENEQLVYSLVDGASSGVASVDPGGSWSYQPNLNFSGTDSFTFKASDAIGVSNTATMSITATSVNDAPTSTPQSPLTIEDTAKAITLAGSDVDLDTLTYEIVTGPTHGSLSGTAPDLTYTPALNYHGPDSFTFRANDGTVDSNTATVSITVTAVNDAPVCAGDTATGAEDEQQSGTIDPCSDADGDTLTYSKVSEPTHGAVTVGSNGTWTYTPAANYHGPDSFTFKVNDGALDADGATVSITVTDVNDLPSANSESSGFFGFPYVASTTTTRLNVLANDTSGPRIGGVTSEPTDPITITAVSGAGRGTVSILPGGAALAYDPRGCLTGDDVFSYTVTDGHGETDPATVAVTVARPGAGGLGNAPITDVPSVGLRSGATIGRTVPVRVTWCGVVRSTSKVKGFRVEQSASAGASWPTLVTRSTTATSASRSIGTSGTYAWRVRTTDTASHTGAYRASATAKAAIRQETPAASVVYAGAWRTSSASTASGGRLRSAASTSSSVTITVAAGTRQVGIVAPKGPIYGNVKVWVDGVYAGRFSERASSASSRGILFVRSVNPGTAHTIVLKPAGNGRVYLDAIVTLQ